MTEEIYKQLNEKLNSNDEELDKFCKDFEKENDINEDKLIGISEEKKDKYLKEYMNHPIIEDEIKEDEIKDENINIEENVEKLKYDSITEYCQNDSCHKKSNQKSKYKFLCKEHQKDGPLLLQLENKTFSLSPDTASKCLLSFHSNLYFLAEAGTRIFSKDQLKGLGQKLERDREQVREAYEEIYKMYGTDNDILKYIANPIFSLGMITLNHIIITGAENMGVDKIELN
jgi:hypothetical protein